MSDKYKRQEINLDDLDMIAGGKIKEAAASWIANNKDSIGDMIQNRTIQVDKINQIINAEGDWDLDDIKQLSAALPGLKFFLSSLGFKLPF